ncbi:hypothetical protein D3C78_1455930 [compost metagenome]
MPDAALPELLSELDIEVSRLEMSFLSLLRPGTVSMAALRSLVFALKVAHVSLCVSFSFVSFNVLVWEKNSAA